MSQPLIHQVRFIQTGLDRLELLGGILLIADENLADIGKLPILAIGGQLIVIRPA